MQFWICMACQYSIFKLVHEDSCKICRAHCLSLVQPAAVRATNKCVSTAQLEEGGKGEVHTINCQVRSGLIQTHWLALLNFAGKTIDCLKLT